MRGRTVLAVAHRLSTVASFDRIIVLSEGRIVEDGSPMELRRRQGVFEAMWQLQTHGGVGQHRSGRNALFEGRDEATGN
jgi:ATP-binding cassette subfamily B protein